MVVQRHEAGKDGAKQSLAILREGGSLLTGGHNCRLHLLLPCGERSEAGIAEVCASVLVFAVAKLLSRVPVAARGVVGEPERPLAAEVLCPQEGRRGVNHLQAVEKARPTRRVARSVQRSGGKRRNSGRG
jgi:hypothetical protein